MAGTLHGTFPVCAMPWYVFIYLLYYIVKCQIKVILQNNIINKYIKKSLKSLKNSYMLKFTVVSKSAFSFFSNW
jgi:hypothetical protein